MAELCLGIARARLGPSAALIDPHNGMAACEENRITRGRQAPTAGPPELAIAELLSYLNHPERDVRTVGVVQDYEDRQWWHGEWCPGMERPEFVEIDPLAAHARYAVASSGFEDAITVMCDAGAADGYFALRANSHHVEPSVGHFPIVPIYSALTEALGFHREREEHLVEAMARAGDPGRSHAGDLITLHANGLSIRDNFQQAVVEACDGPDRELRRRDVAGAVQQKLALGFLELLTRLAKQSGARRVCLSGGLFFNTHFTTRAAQSGVFDETYIPPHPGRGGAALGAALLASGATGAAGATGATSSVRASGALGAPATASHEVRSPYLGPGYSDPQIKEALENCKIAFDLQREDRVIETVLRAISLGQLVGWFHGRLEWGPRALGHRTVLADPFSPHVLDNLNGYLKKRPSYRTYGVSIPLSRLDDVFEGLEPRAGSLEPSPFMQYEYRPRDLEKFRPLLPEGVQTLRVHTVDESEPRYLRLLERWGELSGMPVLVNTSFNGFHEPLVCSPRDAIRVFYGTGLDLLALEDFIVRK